MEINKNREMILNVGKWLMYPFLPLARLDNSQYGGKELGVIVKDDLNVVVLTNIFLLPKTMYEFNRLESIVYDSIDDLLAAGWAVD